MVRILKKLFSLGVLLLGITFLTSCSSTPVSQSLNTPEPQPSAATSTANDIPPTEIILTETSTNAPTETAAETNANPQTQIPSADTLFADVLSVDVSGDLNAYQFTVEIDSPDTGCEQYADWWEVLSQDGDLLYRRILLHSHVNEQPFKRSGGPVSIDAETVVIVRAHMHPHGYGGTVWQGSVEMGFEPVQMDANFAPNLEEIEPLPTGCAF